MSEDQNPIADLVQHALNQDYNKANQIFGDMMGTKINDMLDQEKIRLANQIYNGVDPDEEQLELDLDDETEEDIEAGDEDSEDEDESAEDVDETEQDEDE
jgi:hypothetical protein